MPESLVFIDPYSLIFYFYIRTYIASNAIYKMISIIVIPCKTLQLQHTNSYTRLVYFHILLNKNK